MKAPKTTTQVGELQLAETYLRFVRERLMNAEEPSLAGRVSNLLQEVVMVADRAKVSNV